MADTEESRAIRFIKFDSELYLNADDVLKNIDEAILICDEIGEDEQLFQRSTNRKRFMEGCKTALAHLRSEYVKDISGAEENTKVEDVLDVLVSAGINRHKRSDT